jgi:hypothetical protein
MRMSLSPVEMTSLATAYLEAIPLDGFTQLLDGANTAAQTLLDGVINGNPVVPPEQLQQTFESVGAVVPAITGRFHRWSVTLDSPLLVPLWMIPRRANLCVCRLDQELRRLHKERCPLTGGAGTVGRIGEPSDRSIGAVLFI